MDLNDDDPKDAPPKSPWINTEPYVETTSSELSIKLLQEIDVGTTSTPLDILDDVSTGLKDHAKSSDTAVVTSTTSSASITPEPWSTINTSIDNTPLRIHTKDSSSMKHESR
jgi:hypothetical protein